MTNRNNQHDRKFKNQVNHMHSFIGMPLKNYRSPSLSEIREHDRRLLEKQALGFEPKRKGLLSRLIGKILTVTSKTSGQIAKVGKKTGEIKREISKPVKAGSECCG